MSEFTPELGISFKRLAKRQEDTLRFWDPEKNKFVRKKIPIRTGNPEDLTRKSLFQVYQEDKNAIRLLK